MSTSARASPIAWPGNQICSTAGTASSHGIVTGDPALITTIVFGLAAATAATSSSWSPGNAIVVRSSPSVSQSWSVPTITTATSAAAAAATARSISSPARHGTGADREPSQRLIRGDRVVDLQLVAAPALQLDDAAHLGAAEPVVGAAAPGLGDLDHGRAVEAHRHRADGPHAELPRAGLVGREATGDPGRRARCGDRATPAGPSRCVRRVPVAELDGELAVDRRQELVDHPARLERDVEAAARQRVERTRPEHGPDPRAAAALHPPVPRVRADQRDAAHVRRQREQAPVVLQQHHRPRRGPPDDGVGRGIVGGDLVRPALGGAGPLGRGRAAGRPSGRGRPR